MGCRTRAVTGGSGANGLIIAIKKLSSLIGLTISCPDFTINIGIGSTHHVSVLDWMIVRTLECVFYSL